MIDCTSFEVFGWVTLKDKSGRKEQAGSQRGGTLHMSVVWSCNDQLEEVIVGNPLHARFPTGRNSARPAFAAVYTHPTPLGS